MVSVAASAGRTNEDFVGALPSAAVLVDGAGIRGAESICRHGVAWYAHRLGGSLLGRLSVGPQSSLTELLAETISEVAGDHRDTCDIADPSSPSATVAIVRISGGRIDYLVLGDSFVVLDKTSGAPLVVNDPREVDIRQSLQPMLAEVVEGSEAHARLVQKFRANRNQPGGFWVAKDDPRAAEEALTGSAELSEVARAVLLSNGASRVVDMFGLAHWPEVLSLLESSGPKEIVDRVRDAEASQSVWADDATIAYCTDL
jgi:hypothetical protein